MNLGAILGWHPFEGKSRLMISYDKFIGISFSEGFLAGKKWGGKNFLSFDGFDLAKLLYSFTLRNMYERKKQEWIGKKQVADEIKKLYDHLVSD